jgi:hypothetical protein
MPGRNYPVPAEEQPVIMAVTRRRLKAYWDRCIWSGPTTTVKNAKVDFVPATAICGWSYFR